MGPWHELNEFDATIHYHKRVALRRRAHFICPAAVRFFVISKRFSATMPARRKSPHLAAKKLRAVLYFLYWGLTPET